MSFKDAVDGQKVPDGNFADVRQYLELPHFTPEGIRTKNSAAAGACCCGSAAPCLRAIVLHN